MTVPGIRRFSKFGFNLWSSQTSSSLKDSLQGKSFERCNPSLINNTQVRLASTYRAAVLKDFGNDLVLQDMKRKKLKAGEVIFFLFVC